MLQRRTADICRELPAGHFSGLRLLSSRRQFRRFGAGQHPADLYRRHRRHQSQVLVEAMEAMGIRASLAARSSPPASDAPGPWQRTSSGLASDIVNLSRMTRSQHAEDFVIAAGTAAEGVDCGGDREARARRPLVAFPSILTLRSPASQRAERWCRCGRNNIDGGFRHKPLPASSRRPARRSGSRSRAS
jgi:hypothetical protein